MSQPPNTRSSSAGERHDVADLRRAAFGPLAETDRAHLGQRADGLGEPLRMARTPAMVVVLTAPRPTSSTPSLPRAGAISTGVDTSENYIAVGRRQSAVSSGCGRFRRRTRTAHVTLSADAPESVRAKERPAPPGRRHDRREDGRSCRAGRLRARRTARGGRRESRPVGTRGRRRARRPRSRRARARPPSSGVLVEVEVAPPMSTTARGRAHRSRGRRRHRGDCSARCPLATVPRRCAKSPGF